MLFSLITNVWIVDSGNCIINRQYKKNNEILNDFIIAMFSLAESTQKDNVVNHCFSDSINLYYLSKKRINVVVSTNVNNSEDNLNSLQISETLDYIYMKYIDKYHNSTIKGKKNRNSMVFDEFGEEIDTIFGFAKVIESEINSSINIIPNIQKKSSTVIVKNILEKYGDLNYESGNLIKNNLDEFELLLQNYPFISRKNKIFLLDIVAKLQKFVEFDGWLSSF